MMRLYIRQSLRSAMGTMEGQFVGWLEAEAVAIPEQDTHARVTALVEEYSTTLYRVAYSVTRNAADAEDVVQEACLRAFRFFGGFQGGDPRAWLLKIVRNTSYSFLEKNRPVALAEEFDEQVHVRDVPAFDAEAIMVRDVESRMLRESLEELPVNFREVVVLRELEGLSYKEIAEMIGVPIGTVMSSLARGRDRLRESLLRARAKEGTRGL